MIGRPIVLIGPPITAARGSRGQLRGSSTVRVLLFDRDMNANLALNLAALHRIEIDDVHRRLVIDGDRHVALERRRAMWLIFRRLVEEHRSERGRAISVEELVAAGWPGEVIIPAAAATRVYFVIRELRKAGLEGILLTFAEGYLLDPSVEISTTNAHHAAPSLPRSQARSV